MYCRPHQRKGVEVLKLHCPHTPNTRVAEASFQSLSSPIWIMGIGREEKGQDTEEPPF